MKIKANKGPIRPKKKSQNKEKQNKSPQKYLWICFLLVQLLLAWGLPGVWLIHRWPPWEKASVSFASGYRLQLALVVVRYLHPSSPHPLLPVCTSPTQCWNTIGMPCACCHSLGSSYICAESGCVWETLFLCSHRSPLALNISTSSSPHLLSLEGRGLMTTSHWVLPSLSPSAPCPFVGLHVNSHLLQEEAPLMRVKWGTDL